MKLRNTCGTLVPYTQALALLASASHNLENSTFLPPTVAWLYNFLWSSSSLDSSAKESLMDPPSHFDYPSLTPQFCFSTGALKEFLRISRSTIDDTIAQNLNTLNTPASAPFDPTSTLRRSQPSQLLHADACRTFTENVLLPSWQSRSDVLNYCASVATSDDPDDPDSLVRLAANAADRERIVDERLDPYSGKFYPRESRTEILAGVIRNERMVESIVRERSWRIVGEKCEGGTGGKDHWRIALNEWRKRAAGP